MKYGKTFSMLCKFQLNDELRVIDIVGVKVNRN